MTAKQEKAVRDLIERLQAKDYEAEIVENKLVIRKEQWESYYNEYEFGGVFEVKLSISTPERMEEAFDKTNYDLEKRAIKIYRSKDNTYSLRWIIQSQEVIYDMWEWVQSIIHTWNREYDY